jgi:hypothetical protein
MQVGGLTNLPAVWTQDSPRRRIFPTSREIFSAGWASSLAIRAFLSARRVHQLDAPGYLLDQPSFFSRRPEFFSRIAEQRVRRFQLFSRRAEFICSVRRVICSTGRAFFSGPGAFLPVRRVTSSAHRAFSVALRELPGLVLTKQARAESREAPGATEIDRRVRKAAEDFLCLYPAPKRPARRGAPRDQE